MSLRRVVNRRVRQPRVLMEIGRPLTCGSHGEQPWQGHVVCAHCGAVYQTADPSGERLAPEHCSGCGRRLLPAPRRNWMARPICSECFVDRTRTVTPEGR